MAAAVLRQRDPFDPAPTDTRGLEHELEPGMLGVRSQPGLRPLADAPYLLAIDHLQWIPELGAPLLLHLDDEQPPPAPKDEIELVPADPRVGVEEPVAAEAIVAEGAPLAAIHAASVANAP